MLRPHGRYVVAALLFTGLAVLLVTRGVYGAVEALALLALLLIALVPCAKVAVELLLILSRSTTRLIRTGSRWVRGGDESGGA